MSVPGSYDAAAVSAHISVTLGPVATVLGWADGGPEHALIVRRTLLAYGVGDLAAATDMPKLLALVDAEAWRLAVGHLTTRYDTSEGGQALARSQMVREARQQLAAAERAALPYRYAFMAYRVAYTDEPYVPAAAGATEGGGG